MTPMKRFLPLILAFLAGCTGNTSFSEWFDYESFSWTGGTVLSDPEQVTTKELHFDSGTLIGREVILEGEIVAVGPYYTHLVLNDNVGRMLVVLTQLASAENILKAENPKNIKVLGVVESGKKGVPIIIARSIHPVFPGQET